MVATLFADSMALPACQARLSLRQKSRGVTALLRLDQDHQKDIKASRRRTLISWLHIPALGSLLPSPVMALPQPPINKESSNDIPLIKEMLEKSKANKERYDRERLQSYYRRNFRDYFQFEAGAASARGISPETAAKIQQYLKDNP